MTYYLAVRNKSRIFKHIKLKAALHKAAWRKGARRLTPLQVSILF